jgi:aspartate/glutamate racemase
MAADPVNATVSSPKNFKSGVICKSDCQCCSLMKHDVQALENEVRSKTEIINIIRDELKFIRAYKEDRKSYSTYAEKLKTSNKQCCKCTQLESQLQVALNELSSVKLITNILSP